MRANHQCGGEKVAGELVISRSDAPPILGAAEEVFDFVLLAIETLGAIAFWVALLRLGMTGRAPSSLICRRAFSLS